MKKLLILALAVTASANAFATLITFDDLADNDILSNQYAGLSFFAGHTSAGVANAGNGWATATSMEVATIAGGDVGGVGTPPLLSGTVVHSFDGWLSEDGDASMTIDFVNAISDVSLDFGGVATLGFTGLYAIDGSDNVVASAFVTATTGQQTVSLSGLNVNRIVVVHGDFGDWVGVDNLNYTEAVPEPATMVVLGAAALAAAARKRRK